MEILLEIFKNEMLHIKWVNTPRPLQQITTNLPVVTGMILSRIRRIVNQKHEHCSARIPQASLDLLYTFQQFSWFSDND